MASLWSMLGQAANVMQVAGVDGFGIASMIAQAARTASRNKDLCQLLANKVEVVGDLLRELQIPELRRHRSTRRPLDELRRALFCAYMLVWSCGQQQRNTSQLYQLWKSADMALMLRQAQDEIDGYIILIPMFTAVASLRARVSSLLLHLCYQFSIGFYYTLCSASCGWWLALIWCERKALLIWWEKNTALVFVMLI